MSSVRGYPAACAIYQQRFAFGGYRSRPVNISLSRIGDLWKFENQDVDETVANDHAMDLGLTGLEVNPVVWMNNSTQGLLAGTTGGEFLVQGDTGTLGFGPEDNDISQQSDWGTAVGVRPIRVGASHVFVQRGRRHLQELVFDFEADSFINRDLAALIDDLFENEAKRVEIQEGIESRIWVLFNDGSLGALTFEARQKVFAWGTVETDGTFVDICALPDHDGNDELWALIDRDGGRTLELLGDEYPLKGGDLTSVANFLDSGVYGTPGSATITGIPSHLEGVAVRVVGDGVDYGTKTVSGGSITLPKSVDTVRLGLTYTSRAEGMPLVAQAGTANSSIGLRKRISSIAVSGVNTEDLKAGTGDASPILVKGMHNYNSSYEGVRAEPDDKFAAEKYWVLQADGPRPATVTSVSVIWEFHAK